MFNKKKWNEINEAFGSLQLHADVFEMLSQHHNHTLFLLFFCFSFTDRFF